VESILSVTTFSPTSHCQLLKGPLYQLVIDRNLSSLPRRKTDNAIIIRSQDTPTTKARIFKLNATSSRPVLIERDSGHERQWRFHCPRCTLPIGYQTTPPPAKGPFLYINRGALTQHQGEVPAEAFLGEND
jgi:hypothetical protein